MSETPLDHADVLAAAGVATTHLQWLLGGLLREV
jgi:hypothetical protein